MNLENAKFDHVVSQSIKGRKRRRRRRTTITRTRRKG